MAMTIQELREKRNKAWDEARNFLDSKRTESGVLSEEDSAAYDAMEKTIVDLGKEIQSPRGAPERSDFWNLVPPPGRFSRSKYFPCPLFMLEPPSLVPSVATSLSPFVTFAWILFFSLHAFYTQSSACPRSGQ